MSIAQRLYHDTDAPALAKAFTDFVDRYGRSFELGLATSYHLLNRPLQAMKMGPMGFAMFKRARSSRVMRASISSIFASLSSAIWGASKAWMRNAAVSAPKASSATVRASGESALLVTSRESASFISATASAGRAEGQIVRLQVGVLDRQGQQVFVDGLEVGEEFGELREQILLALGAARVEQLRQIVAVTVNRGGGGAGLIGVLLGVFVGDGHDGALFGFGGRSEVETHLLHQIDAFGFEGDKFGGSLAFLKMQRDQHDHEQQDGPEDHPQNVFRVGLGDHDALLTPRAGTIGAAMVCDL